MLFDKIEATDVNDSTPVVISNYSIMVFARVEVEQLAAIVCFIAFEFLITLMLQKAYSLVVAYLKTFVLIHLTFSLTPKIRQLLDGVKSPMHADLGII